MTEAKRAWIRFAEGALRHAHCVRSEERLHDKPENQDLRDAMFWLNGRRYYDLEKLQAFEARRAAAPPPPKRPAPKRKQLEAT
jgi:hypothetical protein